MKLAKAAMVLAALLQAQQPSPIDRYLEEALKTMPAPPAGSGSLYTSEGPLSDLARDPRARLVNDLITIIVIESATALSKGTTETSRKSSAKAGVASILGQSPARLGDLVTASGANTLAGEGSTSRQSTVTTRLSARVSHVLPNGYMVVDGYREVVVNSERQLISIRGVVRPSDVTRDNTVRSDRLAQMEVRINGKGVVNDAVRRPHFLYRLLLGLLPF